MLLTKTTAAQWPLQLRMPALESNSTPTPHGVGTTLLKRHKILPHSQQQQQNGAKLVNDSYHKVIRQKQFVGTNVASSPAGSTSPPLKDISAKPGGPSLPLTPPTHSRQSSSGYVSFSSANEDIPPPAPSVPGTPVNQRSPPTPGVTLPKAAWRASALRPPVKEQYPTSRPDSFRTAKEIQTPDQSDEDDIFKSRPLLPSSQPSSQGTVQWASIHKTNKAIGLGLGLESDNEGSLTPKPAREIVSFDGEWGSGMGDVSEVKFQWDENLMRNVTVRRRSVIEAFDASPCPTGFPSEIHGDNCLVEPSNAIKPLRTLNLHERVVNLRRERDASTTTKEKSGIRSISPAVVRDSTEIAMSDARRSSNMSGRSQASTLVEAIVVETPARKPNALRRTKKQSTLRQVSTPEASLRELHEQGELPDDLRRRLVHKNSRIPERRHRSLGSTDTRRTISTSSSSGKSREEVFESGAIPVVVIPERTTSSKPPNTPSLRSTSTKHTKGSKSVSETSTAPMSSPAKTNETGFFDLGRRRRGRSTSGSTRSKLGHANGENGTVDIEPIFPVRTSSLSATTSTGTSGTGSRTGSLTAESLRAHNESKGLLLPPHSFLQLPKKPLEPQVVNFSRPSPTDYPQAGRRSFDHNGDPFFGNRRSKQVTPFSQISYETSGTGAEVSEALAITLFPHRNDSILMTQQQPNHVAPRTKNATVHSTSKGPSARLLHTVEESIARREVRVNGEPAFGPVTPPQPIQPLLIDDRHSPLRNPRQAPEPPQVPAIKFTPPSPAATEDDRQLGNSIDLAQESMSPIIEAENKPRRGLSLVRRALSKRRYPEGFFLAGLGRRFSFKERSDVLEESPPGSSRSQFGVEPLYPAAETPLDASRLHPFWRPARFWDDLENEQHYEDEQENRPREYGRVLYENGTYPSVGNRPTPPRRKFSLKRTFAILPLKDEHDYVRNGNETDRRTVKRSPSGNMRVVKKDGLKLQPQTSCIGRHGSAY